MTSVLFSPGNLSSLDNEQKNSSHRLSLSATPNSQASSQQGLTASRTKLLLQMVDDFGGSESDTIGSSKSDSDISISSASDDDDENDSQDRKTTSQEAANKSASKRQQKSNDSSQSSHASLKLVKGLISKEAAQADQLESSTSEIELDFDSDSNTNSTHSSLDPMVKEMLLREYTSSDTDDSNFQGDESDEEELARNTKLNSNTVMGSAKEVIQKKPMEEKSLPRRTPSVKFENEEEEEETDKDDNDDNDSTVISPVQKDKQGSSSKLTPLEASTRLAAQRAAKRIAAGKGAEDSSSSSSSDDAPQKATSTGNKARLAAFKASKKQQPSSGKKNGIKTVVKPENVEDDSDSESHFEEEIVQDDDYEDSSVEKEIVRDGDVDSEESSLGEEHTPHDDDSDASNPVNKSFDENRTLGTDDSIESVYIFDDDDSEDKPLPKTTSQPKNDPPASQPPSAATIKSSKGKAKPSKAGAKKKSKPSSPTNTSTASETTDSSTSSTKESSSSPPGDASANKATSQKPSTTLGAFYAEAKSGSGSSHESTTLKQLLEEDEKLPSLPKPSVNTGTSTERAAKGTAKKAKAKRAISKGNSTAKETTTTDASKAKAVPTPQKVENAATDATPKKEARPLSSPIVKAIAPTKASVETPDPTKKQMRYMTPKSAPIQTPDPTKKHLPPTTPKSATMLTPDPTKKQAKSKSTTPKSASIQTPDPMKKQAKIYATTPKSATMQTPDQTKTQAKSTHKNSTTSRTRTAKGTPPSQEAKPPTKSRPQKTPKTPKYREAAPKETTKPRSLQDIAPPQLAPADSSSEESTLEDDDDSIASNSSEESEYSESLHAPPSKREQKPKAKQKQKTPKTPKSKPKTKKKVIAAPKPDPKPDPPTLVGTKDYDGIWRPPVLAFKKSQQAHDGDGSVESLSNSYTEMHTVGWKGMVGHKKKKSGLDPVSQTPSGKQATFAHQPEGLQHPATTPRHKKQGLLSWVTKTPKPKTPKTPTKDKVAYVPVMSGDHWAQNSDTSLSMEDIRSPKRAPPRTRSSRQSDMSLGSSGELQGANFGEGKSKMGAGLKKLLPWSKKASTKSVDQDPKRSIGRTTSFDKSKYLREKNEREAAEYQTKTVAQMREERLLLIARDRERRQVTKIQALARGYLVRRVLNLSRHRKPSKPDKTPVRDAPNRGTMQPRVSRSEVASGPVNTMDVSLREKMQRPGSRGEVSLASVDPQTQRKRPPPRTRSDYSRDDASRSTLESLDSMEKPKKTIGKTIKKFIPFRTKSSSDKSSDQATQQVQSKFQTGRLQRHTSNGFDTSKYLREKSEREAAEQQTKTVAQMREERRLMIVRDRERREVTKIQAAARGYIVRKRLDLSSGRRKDPPAKVPGSSTGGQSEAPNERNHHVGSQAGPADHMDVSHRDTTQRTGSRSAYPPATYNDTTERTGSRSASNPATHNVPLDLEADRRTTSIADVHRTDASKGSFDSADSLSGSLTESLTEKKPKRSIGKSVKKLLPWRTKSSSKKDEHSGVGLRSTGQDVRPQLHSNDGFDRSKYLREQSQRDEYQTKTVAQMREERQLMIVRDRERREATKIQALVRGFLSRKRYDFRSLESTPLPQRNDRQLGHVAPPAIPRKHETSPFEYEPATPRSTISGLTFDQGTPRVQGRNWEPVREISWRNVQEEIKSKHKQRKGRRGFFSWGKKKHQSSSEKSADTTGHAVEVRKVAQRSGYAGSVRRDRVPQRNDFDKSQYVRNRHERELMESQTKTVAQMRGERQMAVRRDRERRQAIKIQAAARGFMVRKRIQVPKHSSSNQAAGRRAAKGADAGNGSSSGKRSMTAKNRHQQIADTAATRAQPAVVDKQSNITPSIAHRRSSYLRDGKPLSYREERPMTVAEQRSTRLLAMKRDKERRSAIKMQAAARGFMSRQKSGRILNSASIKSDRGLPKSTHGETVPIAVASSSIANNDVAPVLTHSAHKRYQQYKRQGSGFDHAKADAEAARREAEALAEYDIKVRELSELRQKRLRAAPKEYGDKENIVIRSTFRGYMARKLNRMLGRRGAPSLKSVKSVESIDELSAYDPGLSAHSASDAGENHDTGSSLTGTSVDSRSSANRQSPLGGEMYHDEMARVSKEAGPEERAMRVELEEMKNALHAVREERRQLAKLEAERKSGGNIQIRKASPSIGQRSAPPKSKDEVDTPEDWSSKRAALMLKAKQRKQQKEKRREAEVRQVHDKKAAKIQAMIRGVLVRKFLDLRFDSLASEASEDEEIVLQEGGFENSPISQKVEAEPAKPSEGGRNDSKAVGKNLQDIVHQIEVDSDESEELRSETGQSLSSDDARDAAAVKGAQGNLGLGDQSSENESGMVQSPSADDKPTNEKKLTNGKPSVKSANETAVRKDKPNAEKKQTNDKASSKSENATVLNKSHAKATKPTSSSKKKKKTALKSTDGKPAEIAIAVTPTSGSSKTKTAAKSTDGKPAEIAAASASSKKTTANTTESSKPTEIITAATADSDASSSSSKKQATLKSTETAPVGLAANSITTDSGEETVPKPRPTRKPLEPDEEIESWVMPPLTANAATNDAVDDGKSSLSTTSKGTSDTTTTSGRTKRTPHVWRPQPGFDCSYLDRSRGRAQTASYWDTVRDRYHTENEQEQDDEAGFASWAPPSAIRKQTVAHVPEKQMEPQEESSSSSSSSDDSWVPSHSMPATARNMRVDFAGNMQQEDENGMGPASTRRGKDAPEGNGSRNALDTTTGASNKTTRKKKKRKEHKWWRRGALWVLVLVGAGAAVVAIVFLL